MTKSLKFHHIRMAGFAATVPQHYLENKESDLFEDEADFSKFLETTGIRKRHVVGNSGLCTSDLCVDAASRLMDDLAWSPESIDVLIFVSQTPDFALPATSCIIQNRLGLSEQTYALDVSLGCSGWVYGLSVVSGLLESGVFKRALLLAGDTTTMTKSSQDRSTFPLFGDAGTATAIEFVTGYGDMVFDFGTDGSGFEAIMIKDGGYRYPVSETSLKIEKKGDGKVRNDLQSALNGAEVFTFGISQAPKSIRNVLKELGLNTDEVDWYVLHQANRMMNERISGKLGLKESQVPYSLNEFGNTSSASIVLTMCYHKVQSSLKKNIIACGFGVGLSWGSVYFKLDEPHILDINYL